MGMASLGVPESSCEPCHTLHEASPTQSLLIWWLIVEGSASRSLHIPLLVPHAPPSQDVGKLWLPSCPWGWWSVVPMGFSCAGYIGEDCLFF